MKVSLIHNVCVRIHTPEENYHQIIILNNYFNFLQIYEFLLFSKSQVY